MFFLKQKCTGAALPNRGYRKRTLDSLAAHTPANISMTDITNLASSSTQRQKQQRVKKASIMDGNEENNPLPTTTSTSTAINAELAVEPGADLNVGGQAKSVQASVVAGLDLTQDNSNGAAITTAPSSSRHSNATTPQPQQMPPNFLPTQSHDNLPPPLQNDHTQTTSHTCTTIHAELAVEPGADTVAGGRARSVQADVIAGQGPTQRNPTRVTTSPTTSTSRQRNPSPPYPQRQSFECFVIYEDPDYTTLEPAPTAPAARLYNELQSPNTISQTLHHHNSHSRHVASQCPPQTSDQCRSTQPTSHQLQQPNEGYTVLENTVPASSHTVPNNSSPATQMPNEGICIPSQPTAQRLQQPSEGYTVLDDSNNVTASSNTVTDNPRSTSALTTRTVRVPQPPTHTAKRKAAEFGTAASHTAKRQRPTQGHKRSAPSAELSTEPSATTSKRSKRMANLP